MSSSTPASCATGSRSNPSLSAARATAIASIIGLAAVATRAPLAGHQPRRDAHDALTVDEQEPFKGTGDMPAVLERPDPVVLEAAPPFQRCSEAAAADLDRLLAQQLAGARADSGDGMRALVRVRTEHDHHVVPFHLD
jgi:hypothetical protein